MTQPPSEALEQARAALEGGNYAEVRRLLRPLADEQAGSPEQEEAQALLARIEPDPWIGYLLLLTFLLLCAVTAFAYSHGHP